MLEQSSINSSRSNLFNLSEESEREDHPNAMHNYSSFVRKVRTLLEAEGNDLQDLYRKVELIVSKYFKDHQIVEFGDMYNHIAALKSNSKKMTRIVDFLQQQIIRQHSDRPPPPSSSKPSDRTDQFELTSSTQKPPKTVTGPSSGQHNHHSPGNVNTSIKYTYEVSPSFHVGGAAKEAGRREKKERDHSSGSRHSPSQLNSSFEEYQLRNRQYEDKVKQLMLELKDIKQNLSCPKLEEQSIELQHHTELLKERLQIQLDQSDQILEEESVRQELPVELPMRGSMQDNKQNRMSDTKQSQSLSLNRESISIHIRPNPIVVKSERNVSSIQTIGELSSASQERDSGGRESREGRESRQNINMEVRESTKVREDRESKEREYVKGIEAREDIQSKKNMEAREDKEIKLSRESRMSRQRREGREDKQERKSQLIFQANTITNQLKQLKEVASMLNIDSNDKHNTSQGSMLRSETKILQLTSQLAKDTPDHPLPPDQSYQSYQGQQVREVHGWQDQERKMLNTHPPTRPHSEDNDANKTEACQERSRHQVQLQSGISQYSMEEEYAGRQFIAVGRRPMLDQISNTSSKVQPTQQVIPSFNNVEDRASQQINYSSTRTIEAGRAVTTSILAREAGEGGGRRTLPDASERLIDSSLFSFRSNSRYAPPPMERSHPAFPSQAPVPHPSYSGLQYQPRPADNLAVSTVRHGFNPYDPHLSEQHHPQIRFASEQQQSPFMNRSTPIWAHPSHQMNRPVIQSQHRPDSQPRGSLEKKSIQKRYSHLRNGGNGNNNGNRNVQNVRYGQNLPGRRSDRPNVRFVIPMGASSNASEISMNSSGSSFQRRGLKVVSPGSGAG